MNSRNTALVVLLALAPLASAQQKRSVTFEDILALEGVGAPMISPDGQSVAYTITAWEEAEDGKMSSVSHLCRVGVDDGVATQLTSGKKGESSPRWSPDGRRISFLAARGEGDEAKDPIWLLPSSGGEATQLTESKEGVLDCARPYWPADGVLPCAERSRRTRRARFLPARRPRASRVLPPPGSHAAAIRVDGGAHARSNTGVELGFWLANMDLPLNCYIGIANIK